MTDNNMDYGKKNIFLSIVIIMIGLLVGGATYAFLISGTNIFNGNYLYNTSCFNIFYDITNDDGETNNLSGTLLPSSNSFGGLYGKIIFGLAAECNLNATADIMLQVYDMNSYNNASNTYIQTVRNHCEYTSTLETLAEYTTESECMAQTGTEWVTDGTALKYSVYVGTDMSVPIKTGYINTYNESIDLHTFSIMNTPTNDTDDDTILDYYVYIWLDGNLVDDTYSNMPFKGHISASVIQHET